MDYMNLVMNNEQQLDQVRRYYTKCISMLNPLLEYTHRCVRERQSRVLVCQK
jgi:hypothetical protein